MKPGEYFVDDGELTLNEGLPSIEIRVANTGDRPVQVGSNYVVEGVLRIQPARFIRSQAATARSGTGLRCHPRTVRPTSNDAIARPTNWFKSLGV